MERATILRENIAESSERDRSRFLTPEGEELQALLEHDRDALLDRRVEDLPLRAVPTRGHRSRDPLCAI